MIITKNNYDEHPSYLLDYLAINTIFGVYAHERQAAQELIISLSAQLDSKPINPDLLKHMLTQIINNYLEEHQPQLLEKIALDLACSILEQLSLIMHLVLTIKKPGALPQAEFSYLTITMTRSGEKIIS